MEHDDVGGLRGPGLDRPPFADLVARELRTRCTKRTRVVQDHVVQLVTLVDPARFDPAIDDNAFPETASEAYWTASPVPSSAEQSFYLNLFFGYTSSNQRAYEQFVRCVRNADQPELPTVDRYRIEGGVVLDRMTGLYWERAPRLAALALDETKTYCGALVIDGRRVLPPEAFSAYEGIGR